MVGFAALELAQSCSQLNSVSTHHSSIPCSSIHSSFAPLTVFCDFDGPIVDVSDRYYSTYKLGLIEVQSIYQKQGVALPLHLLTKEQFWQMKQERTPDIEIALRSGLRGQQIDRFLHRVRQIVNRDDLLHQDHLQPGVRWALSQLHAQGVLLILVTLRRQSQAIQLLRQFGIAHLFTQIHGTDDDEAAYQNQAEQKTQLLADAMAEVGLLQHSHCHFRQSSSAAWMIGDTEADILAGQTMNIPTIAVTCGIRSHTYLQRFVPTQVHRDLAAAAHYLVRSSQEIA